MIMASGRMEFHAQSIMQHASFAFVLPNDVEMAEVREPRHYDRPTKSLILLHGLTGTDTDWLYGGLAQTMAIQYNLAVFMPAAGNNFYLDRGYPGGNWGGYVGEELPDYIQKVFGFCAKREDTIIGGLSMGGYGALHTALNYPERFSSCIALSSALRIRAIAAGKHDGVVPPAMLYDIFGDTATLLESDRNPEWQYMRLKGKEIPEIYLAIGTEDSLYGANQEFRQFLAEQDASFRYEEGPGGHNWFFWNEYLDRALAWTLRP
jgi:S-formylglutathione hydrolase FrmB